MQQVLKGTLAAYISAAAVLLAAAFSSTAVASEIQSLLQRGLPVSVDPSAQVQNGGSRAYPLHPVDRLPFYGLPYGLVDTTTGRLAFRVDDFTLPGYMPIQMSRFYDSGGGANHGGDIEIIIDPLEGGAIPGDLGPFWTL